MKTAKKLFILIVSLSFFHYSFGQGSEKMLSFNGSSSYVNCGNMNLSGNAITLQGWIKINAFKTAHPFITSFIGIESGGTSHAQIRLGDAGHPADRVQFILYIGSSHIKLNGQRALLPNTWYHIAATYDGSFMRIYINGNLDVQQAQTGNFTANTQFNIGQNYSADRTTNGRIEEVSVFKSALSQTTIRNWMCKKINSAHPNYSTLEAYFPLNEGTGNTTTDASVNNHNGTLIASPAWENSEIPIADEVVTSFSSPFSLTLANPDGDTLWANNVTGNPEASFLYRVNALPGIQASFPSQVAEADSTRYYGLFFLGGNNPTAAIKYRVTSNQNFQNVNTCIFNWYTRTGNSDLTWSAANANFQGHYYNLTGVAAGEYILGFGGSDVIYSKLTEQICVGDSVLLQHNSAGLNYTWLFNGNILPNQNQASLHVKNTGVYQMAYALGTTCFDTTQSLTLTVNSLPAVGFSPLPTVCASHGMLSLTGGTPAGGTYSSPFIAAGNFMVSIAGAGKYPINYVYTDGNGCSADTTQFITIKPLPNVNLPNYGNVCINDSVISLNQGTPAGGTYFVSGNVATQFNPSQGIGLYKIKYVFNDTNGCAAADSSSIIVRSLPTVNLSLIDTFLCESFDPIALKGENPPGGTFTGSGVTGSAFSPLVGAGWHTIVYNYTEPLTGCSNSARDSIEVYPTPQVPVVTNNNDTLVGPVAYKYYWYNSDSVYFNNNKQQFVPDSTGYYYLIVENNYGCQSDASGLVFWEKPKIENPKSIEELTEKLGLSIFPNPSHNGVFQVTANMPLERLEVYNAGGQLMLLEQNFVHLNKQLNLPSGIYFLVVQSNQIKQRSKLVVY